MGEVWQHRCHGVIYLEIVRERDLKSSLEAIGVQIPGLKYAGELVDGRRKQRLCAQLRIPYTVHEAHSLKEACSILFTRHPDRALELAGTTSLHELAQLCSTTTTAIANELAAQKGPPKRPAHSRIIRANYPALKERKMTRVIFTLEPELRAYAKEAAERAGHRNVSKLIRRAIWKEVVLLVPNAGQFQPARCVPKPFDSKSAKRARRARGR